MTNKLTITAWNMSCMFPVAGPYLNTILSGTDVLALSEHGLYPCELYKLNNVSPDYISMAKSSRQLSDNNFGSGRGVGGSAILWHKRLSSNVRPLPELGSDRMCAIEIILPNNARLYVISVYLPHQSCYIYDFKE